LTDKNWCQKESLTNWKIYKNLKIFILQQSKKLKNKILSMNIIMNLFKNLKHNLFPHKFLNKIKFLIIKA